MNAKKLVMLLAVVAIGVVLMWQFDVIGGGDDAATTPCNCCEEFVMDADGNATTEANANYDENCDCCTSDDDTPPADDDTPPADDDTPPADDDTPPAGV